MYTIGIIHNEFKKIEAVIKRTLLDPVGFRMYTKETLDEIVKDINENTIQCMVLGCGADAGSVNGAALYGGIREKIPEFPVVILTDLDGELKSSRYVDADKVYSEKVFFGDQEVSCRMCQKIILNMTRYAEERRWREEEYRNAIAQLKEEGSAERMEAAMHWEQELGRYRELDTKVMDGIFGMQDLKDQLSSLAEALEKAI